MPQSQPNKLMSRLIGRSPMMTLLRDEVAMYSDTTASVLICGPSGSGKEVVARALHDLSARQDRPFVAINCGAIPADLLESELFGHEKGAFTGAIAQRRGRFEEAHGGTLFLDEIGDMPLEMQVKLLRVLEDGHIQRVGGKGQTPVDVRIIAATHRDIDVAINDGRFREDLFYRIAVLSIFLPALAQRTEDIAELINYFQQVSKLKPHALFTPDAIQRCMNHQWPGNVRELRNLVQRAAVLYAGKSVGAAEVEGLLCMRGRLADKMSSTTPINTSQSEVQPIGDLATVANVPLAKNVVPLEWPLDNAPLDLAQMVAEFERRSINRAMERAGGNVSEASRLLSLQRTTLISKLQKYALGKVAA